MLAFKRDRRFLPDSATSSSPLHTRKSSLSLSEKSSGSSTRRRSSTPQIWLASSSASFAGVKRSPLAPLDPQASSGLQTDISLKDMADEHPQFGRKSSITLTNASRPTPYPKRTSSRRPLPSTQHRRTSLPAIHLEPNSDSSITALSDSSSTQDNDIYSDLNSYTFGDAHNSLTLPTRRADNSESVSPLHRLASVDLTPRPSVAPTSRSHQSHSNGWSSPSEDEAEERRRSTRGKLRAIDDGTRRPSLPTNDPDHILPPPAVKKNKGKTKASTDPQSSRENTENEGDLSMEELDTYVDHMYVDGDPLISDRSSFRTFGGVSRDETVSVYGAGWDTDDRERGTRGEHEDKRIHKHEQPDDGPAGKDERRSSLPMDIPQPRFSISTYTNPYTPGPDMHTIAQMRRPSRSMDDDLNLLGLQKRGSRGSESMLSHGGVAGVGPASEPNMRGLAIAHAQEEAVALSLEEHIGEDGQGPDARRQAEPPNESVYQGLGLDLDYIMSGVAMLPPNSARPNGSPSMFDWRKNSSGTISGSGQRGSLGFNSRGSSGLVGDRRTSTATFTTMGEDTFLSQLRKNDGAYTDQARDWSFIRERAEGRDAGLGSGERGGSELWRSQWVGRYDVQRSQNHSADPSKPRRVRLDVRHIPDPFSMGNKRGGPRIYIHQHLRAQAFSIFRAYGLPQRHLKTEASILLAPKRVQLQFTSTHSTSLLSTHGLLEDGSTRDRSGHRDREGRTRERNESGRQPREREQRSRNNGYTRAVSSRGESSTGTSSQASSQTSSGGSVTVSGAYTIENLATDGSRPSTASSQPSGISHDANLSLSTIEHPLIASSPANVSPHERYVGNLPPASRTQGSIASLEDQPLPRTSHKEAFATMDPSSIEYQFAHSGKSAYYPGQEASPHPLFRGFFKLFQAPPTKNSPSRGSPPNARPEGNYKPPWVTMAARREQEEQDRASKNLDESFSTVGLTPSPGKSSRVKSEKRSKTRRNETSAKVLDHVPNDSLYMLLPMWPGETDANSTNSLEDPTKYVIPNHGRQYLLVFYKSTASKGKGGKDNDKEKKQKAPRQSQTGSNSSTHSDSGENKNAIALTSFDIGGRLVSYEDVHGSGIRVPTKGLSVSGPLQEAVDTVPRVRFQTDDGSVLLGFCRKRERGVEFVPEAAGKLGLCLPRMTADDPEVLTPIGRAAVEMAWLGALAVMGFNTGL